MHTHTHTHRVYVISKCCSVVTNKSKMKDCHLVMILPYIYQPVRLFFFFACIFMSICPNTSFYVFFPSVFSFSASCPSVQHSLCWSNLKLCLRVCLVCFLFLTVFLCLGWSIIQLSTDTATCLSLGLHVFLPWSLCL